ncbi:MAG: hypothetical protein ACL7BU_14200 [Candidatus Phlomobacter fragariae]
MKTNNHPLTIENHQFIGEVIALTTPHNNSHYLLNLAPPVYADEETKTLINMIQILAEENKYLRKENKRLAKTHR